MISLQEIYDYLGSGELSNLFIADGGLGTGILKPEYHEVVNRSIYLGLVDLHTRFILKRRWIEYDNLAGHYITIDVPDLIEIIQVKVNDRILNVNRSDGYVLLDTHRIKLGNAISADDKVEIEYQANHTPIIEITKSIDLPRSYINALLYFIASRLFTSIPNQLDGDLNEGMRYAQKYQQEIAMLQSKGVDVDDFNEMCLFHEKGFV